MNSSKSTKTKPLSEKRAPLPRASDRTKEFKNDWQRLSNSGRYDMKALRAVMTLLINNDGPLPAQHNDHDLTGEWQDHRECHIGGDFLLIYRLSGTKKDEAVVFTRAGTHAELFKKC
ncbi:type II toxin-antitoxin system YafQ family toxin [Xanthomonas campestris pv. campestris]|uniref:type II toxin-antitoxin system YafQ family toxin n=2 Tax=Xanthomonas TaxID=338 RepID=UPI000E3268C8|nr:MULTISPECIES: type II toxin-antitoxin system YafQ family toxin [Xanthomonas]MEA9772243.1 type II toxin-antitoxin system YafQ family toxin [Xanthomonas campestris pv. raphani]MEA9800503.1 type II toxin-antitoxin system YafQ family toxin [Xanthomonas campestris pv. raphani]MEA9833195.1 type II toxin-antitoxin system YafQ family toxin [Xanthomonas campestris pv. raphani]MEA9921510.1 type II toxin-antitoxin system YafQ family toxin [Xanthomonas campestris pv. raphani]MEA9949702.1 type II toxin-